MIVWDDSFSVKDSVIDGQHKQLVSKLNELLEATKSGQGKDKVLEIVNFLGQYAQTHFTYEENYMKQNIFPGLEEHKKIHESFIGDFTNFKNEIETQGITSLITIKVQSFLMNWLINHIKVEDHKYSDFISK